MNARWGAEDERGAANLLDQDGVRRGLAAVTDNRSFSLAAPIVPNQGFGVVGRNAPQHFMVRDGGDYAAGLAERPGFGFADDWIAMPAHGVSHLDALSHVWQDGVMYNGYPASAVTSRGASRLGIEKVGPIVTRGILLDLVPEGRTYLEPGESVHATTLEAALAATGVTPEPGDALLVRTGWLGAQRSGAVDGTAWPGLDADCADLLASLDLVLVGADNPGVEALPSSDPDCQVPLHVALIRGRGMYFAELLDLDELAAAGRTAFLLVLSPLPVVGGVGGPVTPVAVV
ncbi:MAG: cyclase family protein [Nocardioides sp.]|uniref:cyclase family protein n=1 Tax=Nocardioides sp. TaxID=35761 RepID=UPI0039E23704